MQQPSHENSKKLFSDALEEKKVKKILVSARSDAGQELGQYNDHAVKELLDKKFILEKFNGEKHFNLSDMHRKVVDAADGFVFLPMPDKHNRMEPSTAYKFYLEMFKMASLFVGVQTEDEKLRLNSQNDNSPIKPIVLVNHNKCYDPFLGLIKHLIQMGVVGERYQDVIKTVDSVDDAIGVLHNAHLGKGADQYHHAWHTANSHLAKDIILKPNPASEKPPYSVCVFCSAGTHNKELLGIAEEAGQKLAAKGWGVISGMGRTGMMGAVARGAAEEKKRSGRGWIGGSNLPRIIGMEGLPEGYDELWLREDIYKRMEAMIENSQAFMVMPGGMGTVQELAGLLLLKYNAKHKEHEKEKYLMSDDKFGNKPIVLVNHNFRDGPCKGHDFWEPIVEMARQFGFEHDIKVVNSVQEGVKLLHSHYQHGMER